MRALSLEIIFRTQNSRSSEYSLLESPWRIFSPKPVPSQERIFCPQTQQPRTRRISFACENGAFQKK